MRAAVCALLIALVSLTSSRLASAEEPSDLDSGEARAHLYFVPRLVGALSVDGALMTGFPLGSTGSDYPATWGFSAGWRQNFDGHGKLSLRTALVYERGSLFGAALEGTSNRFGLSLSPALRGYSPDWVFGGIALLLDVSVLTFQPPGSPFGGLAPDPVSGWQVGVGVETTFGALFFLDPWLFAESGASATLSRVTLGESETWEIWARWVLRFDWAVRGSDYSSPTVSSP